MADGPVDETYETPPTGRVVRLINAEALTVGPDEILIVRVPEIMSDWVAEISAALAGIGLKDRSLVVAGDVAFVKARRDPSTGSASAAADEGAPEETWFNKTSAAADEPGETPA